jgi:HPt (histidine-containing phosphotransfer) domain-containing protein
MALKQSLINTRYFDENFGDDKAFIHEMLVLFSKDLPVKFSALKDALSSKDHEKIRSAAHAIKASIKMLGIDEMADLLDKMEMEAKQQVSLDVLEGDLIKAEDYFLAAMQDLDRLISSND